MDFMLDMINNGVIGFFGNVANSFLSEAFKLLTSFLLGFSDLNKYITISDYLKFSQAIAGALLVTSVTWEGFKKQTGGAFNTNTSISVLVMKTIFAGAGIYILPYSVTKILIPINEAFVKAISKMGMANSYDKDFETILGLFSDLRKQGIVLVFGLLILAIALLILSVVSAIRYIDLIICIIIAPFSAISIVGSTEGAITWAKETSSIVFTQAIHVLILQILLRVMLKEPNITGILLSIGAIVVMIRGANILKGFMYKSGAGAGVLSISSMAVMKSNISMLSPTKSIGK